jgi:hypothetical protein
MNRPLYWAAWAAGLAALGWIAAGYLAANPLALAMTLLIAAFYGMGTLELHRFQKATATLARALAGLREPPAALGPWLDTLHPSLQNAVRLRIEGERTGLPGPAMAPYLAGLLVLLGMLGTFLGMVVTLKGTGLALESATDVQAIRASLIAPVKGLGLAFGTSVAGVAASAMLGLMSALCRRERLQAVQQLDARIATVLRPFSLAHQRDESFRLLQRQAQAMPELVSGLQALLGRIEQQGEALNARLAAGQDSFHARAEAAYTGLAASVDRSLQRSLAESARAAGAAIQPAVEATMAGLAREAASLHDTLRRNVQQQLDELASRVAQTFELRSAALVQAVDRAQAGMTAELRQKLSDSLARDNAALAEREQLLGKLGTLLDTLEQAAAAQHGAVDTLLGSSAAMLQDAGARFADTAQAEGEKLGAAAAQVTSSAVEVASLGEALGAAVEQFAQANGQLMAQLQRIEAGLGQSLARSDEQLAYYVAQARELIDLSVMSQKQIVEDLQQLAASRRAAPALDAA